jgi:hypothetical protein
MPIAANTTRRKYRVPGLYASLLESAAVAAEVVDPRARHSEYTVKHDAGSRRLLNSTSPTAKAAARKLRSLDAGEPQLVPVAMVVGFPGADAVPWIAAVREVPDTTAEHDAMCWLVRVFVDDRVEIGQTVAQMWRQAAAVADGFTVGRVADSGEYIAQGYDPDAKERRDIAPGDDVVFGDVPEAD